MKNQETGRNCYRYTLAKTILSARKHSEIPPGSASVGQRTKGPGERGEVLGFPLFLWAGPEVRGRAKDRVEGGCHLPPAVYPPPTHLKP